jgi:hypothetical protein
MSSLLELAWNQIRDNSLELSGNPQNFVNYAAFYWPYHCDASGSSNCRGKVKQFLFQESEIAPAFKIRTSSVKTSQIDIDWILAHLQYDRYTHSLGTICAPQTPLLLACMYGWNDAVENVRTSAMLIGISVTILGRHPP